MALPIGSFDQLRRDLRMLLMDLRGVHDPPFAPRAPSHVLATRKLVVREVVRETADAVTLVFEDATRAPFRFVAGQFMTLLVPVGGETLRRAYSASSSPRAPGRIAVTVKRVPGGRASTRLVERTRAGDVLEALGPSGTFTFVPDVRARRPLVLVAGGSGITPIMAIVREALEVEVESKLLLVYANRRPEDVIFADAFDELARAYRHRFELRHAYGERFDPAALAGVDPRAEVYLCGPEPMMRVVREALPEARIREERYTREKAPVKERARRRVTVRMHGADRAFDVAPATTILEAGLAAGVPMPFSCSVGGCGACRVKVVAGRVETDAGSCLTDREREEGYALACCAAPLEDAIVEAP